MNPEVPGPNHPPECPHDRTSKAHCLPLAWGLGLWLWPTPYITTGWSTLGTLGTSLWSTAIRYSHTHTEYLLSYWYPSCLLIQFLSLLFLPFLSHLLHPTSLATSYHIADLLPDQSSCPLRVAISPGQVSRIRVSRAVVLQPTHSYTHNHTHTHTHPLLCLFVAKR